jgi:hypothetical protein
VVCNFLQLYMVLDYMLLFSIHPFSLRAWKPQLIRAQIVTRLTTHFTIQT